MMPSDGGDIGNDPPVPGNFPRLPSGIEQPEMEDVQGSPARAAHRRMESRNLQQTTAEHPSTRASNVHGFGKGPSRARANTAIRAPSEEGSENSVPQSDPEDPDKVILQGRDGQEYGLGVNKTSVHYLYLLIKEQDKKLSKQVESSTNLEKGIDLMMAKIDRLANTINQATADQSVRANLPQKGPATSFTIPPEGVRLNARENLQSPPENFYQAARPGTPVVRQSAPTQAAPVAGYNTPAALRNAPTWAASSAGHVHPVVRRSAPT